MARFAGSVFLAALFIVSVSSFDLPSSDKSKKGKVNWMSPEEAYARAAESPRKILVDLYTDWCGWCKVMDRETYAKAEVADYINSNYYPVKFNAEQRQSIKLGDKSYHFMARGKGGIHSWALVLSQNKPSFPTTVFLDEHLKLIQPIPGYIKPKEFFQIVTFFGDDHYKKESFQEYVKETFDKLY